jgi:hypothetical protein
MTSLTGLQKAAIERALESANNLYKGISKDGKCELGGFAYDYASLEIIEIKHWLQEVIKDSEADK